MEIAKYILFGCISLSLLSCGQSSQIKNPIESKSFAEAYGDGQYWREKFSLPIEPTAFETSLPKAGAAGPVLNQLVKLLLKVGVVGGRKKFSLNQPIPELPSEYIHAVKLSRVFFVLEGEKIDFLKKLAVMVTPKSIHNEDAIMVASPTDTVKMSKAEEKRYLDLFNPKSLSGQVASKRTDEEVLMIKYDQENNLDSANSKNLEYVFLINTTNPAGMLEHIEDRLGFKDKGFIVHKEQMQGALLVEVIPDPQVKAVFKYEMQRASADVEFGFGNMIECDHTVCLDMRVPDLNVLELILRKNSIQLEAFVDVGRAPRTFSLKGYVQFEATLKDPILVDGIGANSTGI